MARHQQRLTQVLKHPEALPATALDALALVPMVDAALINFGSTWPLAPDLIGRSGWVDHIHWGVDQTVEASRNLLAGRLFAAIVIARQQLERWTENVAHHHGIGPKENESVVDLFRRVWSVYPWIDIDVGTSWARLSEWIHGRDCIANAISWEWIAGDLSTRSIVVPEAYTLAATEVSRVLRIVFGQIRGCVSTLARENGDLAIAERMQTEVRLGEVHWPSGAPGMFIAPMDRVVTGSKTAQEFLGMGTVYRKMLPQRDLLRLGAPIVHSDLLLGAILERRGRAVRRARKGFSEERRILGSDYHPEMLDARLFRYIAISEVADIVARWHSGPEKLALTTAASALRSAWCLWLEDTDLSLACIRIVLEQTCRARAWRLRPKSAAKLEANPKLASPARWIEAAGWRRAGVLGKALGEFSHFSIRARWSGARSALEALQPSDVSEAERPLTARGHALESAAYMLAYEVMQRLEIVSDGLAEGFRREVTLLDTDAHEKDIEALLDRGLTLRSFDFGPPDFKSDSH